MPIILPLLLTTSETRETEALIAAMDKKPSIQRARLLDEVIRDMQTGANASWGRIIDLVVTASHDEQAAYLNWKDPKTYTMTKVGTPTFTVDRGVAGDGTTSYGDTGFAGSTAGDIFNQNDHCFGMWTDTELQTNLFGFGGGGERIGIAPRRTDNLIQFYSSNGSTVTTTNTVTTSKGLTMINRSSSSAVQVYKDGALFESISAGAFSQNSTTMKLGASSTTPTTTHRFNGYVFAGTMTSGQQLNYYNAMKKWFDGVGVSFA